MALEDLEADLSRVTAERDAARAEVERLKEALKKFGKHPVSCQGWETVMGERLNPCTCGLDSALAGPGKEE